MTEIVWSDPPPAQRGDKFTYFWEALRARPGEWAEYPGNPHGVHTQMKRRGGLYEAVTRKVEGGPRKAWVRYLGEVEEA